MKTLKKISGLLLCVFLFVLLTFTITYIENNVKINKKITLKESYNTKAVIDKSGEKELVIDSISNNSKLFELPFYCYLMIIGECLLLSLSIIYLFVFCIHDKNIRYVLRNKNKILLYSIIVSCLFLVLFIVSITLTKTIFKPEVAPSGKPKIYINGAKEVIGKNVKITGEINTNYIDKSCLLIKDKGYVSLNNSVLMKINGNSSNINSSRENGLNSTLAIVNNSSADIKGVKVFSHSKGSSGIYVRGDKSILNIKDSNIETFKSNSPSIEIEYGASTTSITSKYRSNDIKSPNVLISKEIGNITLDRCELYSSASENINSLGSINIVNSTLNSNSNNINLKENAMINIRNSLLNAFNVDKKSNQFYKKENIIIKNSKDIKNSKASLIMNDSTVKISKKNKFYNDMSMFGVYNNDANINLSNNKFKYNGSKFLNIYGKSSVSLIVDNEDIKGDIDLDKDASLTFSIVSNSNYVGSINKSGRSKNVILNIDKSSTIVLNSDMYVKRLEDDEKNYNNINLNGYKLYVNNKELEKD